MTTPSPSNDRRHARRVLVTLVITTAAAAVTAGVVLKKHPPAEAAVQGADASAARTVAPASPAFPHRVEWRDPWKRPAPAGDSTAASTHGAADDGGSRSDPSLPSAAGALQRGADSTEEPATF